MDAPPPARRRWGPQRMAFFRRFPKGTPPAWPAVEVWIDENVPPAERADFRTWVEGQIGARPLSKAARRKTYPLIDQLEEFELYRTIDAGGMGVVYEAYDSLLDRTVAIKRPRQDVPIERIDLAARFEVEVRLTASHPHPSIPPVYRRGLGADGRPYMAMLYVDGEPLTDLLARQGEPFDHLLDAVLKVCQAVGSRHDENMIHRDLKPSNVRLGEKGEVFVLDWGLSREWGVADASSPPTQASSSGTLAYMAPEQFRGVATPRTDVFQIGGILCELLTGRPPYPAGVAAEDERAVALEDTHGRLKAVAEGGRGALADLARRCLSTDPRGRPENGAALAKEIADLRAKAEEDGRLAEVARHQAEVARQQAEVAVHKAKVATQEAEVEKREARAQIIVATADRLKSRSALVAGVAAATAFGLATAFVLYRGVTERQEAAARNENRRMAEVALERAEAGVRTGRPPYDAIDTALIQADQRLNAVGCDDLRPRAESCRADLALLKDLDAADDLLFTTTDGGWGLIPRDRVADEYAAAFRRYGVDPAAAGGGAVERLNRSLVRERAITSLDLWLIAGRAENVLRLLEAADDDAFRTTVRRAIRAGDQAALRRLPENPQAAAQPVWFAVVFGQLSAVPADLRRQQLLAAVRLTPDNFPVLMTLGKLRPIGQAAGAAERVRWYQAAAAARPKHEEVLLALGAALADDGQHAAAAACYMEILAVNPRHAFAHNNLGNALNRLNQPDKALFHFGEAARLDPNYAFPLNGAGVAWKSKGEKHHAEAFFSYEAAIRLNPGYAVPHWNLGRLHLDRKEWDRAEARYRESIRLDSTNATTHNELGYVLLERPTRRPTDLAEAVRCYEKAVALSPKWAVPHNGLGVSLRQQGKLSEAEERFRQALVLDPKFAAAYVGLANSLYDRGQWADAARGYEKAAELDASLVSAHNGLGNALLEMGNVTGAEASLRRALNLDPKYTFAHNGLGNLLYRKPNRTDQDLTDAIKSYQRAIELEPLLPQPRNGLGNALRAQKKWQEAADSFAAALRVSPAYKAAHLGLGNSLIDIGDLDKARTEFHKFLAQGPGRHRHQAHTGLGKIAERRRAWDEAELHYRLALETEPKFLPAQEGLQRAMAERSKAGGTGPP